MRETKLVCLSLHKNPPISYCSKRDQILPGHSSRLFPSSTIFLSKVLLSISNCIHIMQAEEKPWWSVFPAPHRTAPVYPKENLLREFNILQDVLNAGTLLIDVRRTDYEGI